MMICGRKTITLPTPEISPFCRKLCNMPGKRVAHDLAERREAGGQQFHHWLRPAENRLEHHEQDQGENEETGDGMQHHGVDAGRQCVRLGRQCHVSRMIRSASRCVAFNSASSAASRCSGQFAAAARRVGQPEQLFDAAFAHRDRGDDRDAECSGQAIDIDIDAAPSRDDETVQYDQQGPPGALEFKHQSERQPKVGRIRHAQHKIGQSFVGKSTEHHGQGDFLSGLRPRSE